MTQQRLGRPPVFFGHRRTIMANDKDYDLLLKVGKKNASAGLRRLCEMWRNNGTVQAEPPEHTCNCND